MVLVGRLAIAWTADIIPIGTSIGGAYVLGPFGMFVGSLGSIIGATGGDLLKYEIEEKLSKNVQDR